MYVYIYIYMYIYIWIYTHNIYIYIYIHIIRDEFPKNPTMLRKWGQAAVSVFSECGPEDW